jgi:hypothetical protein
MSTHQFVPTLAQLHELCNVVQVPTFTKSYAQFIYDLDPGCERHLKIAAKLDNCSTIWRTHDTPKGRYKQNISACKRRGCIHCSQLLATAEYEKYRKLHLICPENFTILRFEGDGKLIRSLLAPLGPILSKLGCPEGGRLVHKVLLLASIHSIPTPTIELLRSHDYSLQVSSHPKVDFFERLRLVLAPDLPTNYSLRAELELSKRVLFFQGLSQQGRKDIKLSGIEKDTLPDNFSVGSTQDPPPEPLCKVPGCFRHTKSHGPQTPESEFVWISTVPPVPSPPS